MDRHIIARYVVNDTKEAGFCGGALKGASMRLCLLFQRFPEQNMNQIDRDCSTPINLTWSVQIHPDHVRRLTSYSPRLTSSLADEQNEFSIQQTT